MGEYRVGWLRKHIIITTNWRDLTLLIIGSASVIE